MKEFAAAIRKIKTDGARQKPTDRAFAALDEMMRAGALREASELLDVLDEVIKATRELIADPAALRRYVASLDAKSRFVAVSTISG